MPRARRILRTASFIVLLLILAAAGAYAALQTGPARRAVARGIETLLSSPTARVRIGHIHGRVPQRITVDEIVVSDDAGPWLRATDAALQWRPLALLRGTVDVENVVVQRLDVSRRPDGDKAASDSAAPPPALRVPQLPVGVDVQRVAVHHLHLAESVVGRAADLAMTGACRLQEHGPVHLVVHAERRDEIAGHIDTTLKFAPATHELFVDVDLHEEAGGLLAAALGIADQAPARLTVQGSGPLARWRGAVQGDVGRLVHVDAEVRGVSTGSGLEATGRANLAGLVHGPVRDLLGQDFTFALVAGWESRALRLRELRVEGPTARAAFTGNWDVGSDALHGVVEAEATALDAVNRYLEPVSLGELRGKLTLGGTLRLPTANGDVIACDVRSPHASAEVVQATLSLHRAEIDARTSDFDMHLEGHVAGLRCADAAVSPLCGDRATVTLAGRYVASTATAHIREAVVVTAAAKVSGQGQFEFAQPAGRLSVDFDVPDVSEMATVLGVPGVLGGLGGHADLRSANLRNGAVADVHLAGRNLQTGQTIVDGAIGPAPRANAVVRITDWTALEATEVEIHGLHARAQGNVELSARFSQIEAEVAVMLDDLSTLPPPFQADVRGRATLTAHADGPIGNPRITGRARVADGVVSGVTFSAADMQFAMPGLTPLRGTVTASIAWGTGAIRGATAFALHDEPAAVAFTELAVDGPGLTLTGDLAVPLHGAPMEGRLTGDSPDLAALGEWIGVDASGTATFDLQLEAAEGVQGARVTCEAASGDLELRPGRRAAWDVLTVTADVRDAFGTPGGSARLQAAGVRSAALVLDTLSLGLDGVAGALAFESRAAGRMGGPVHFAARGDVAWDSRARRVTLTALEATAFGEPVRLRTPAAILTDDDTFALEHLDATVSSGRVTAAARLTAEEVQGQVEMENMPLALVQLAVPSLGLAGRVDGLVTVTGSPSAPDGHARVAVTDIRAPSLGADEGTGVSASLEAALGAGKLRALGSLTGGAESHATVTATIPLRISARPPALVVPADAPVDASVHLRGELGPLWPVLAVDRHQLRGTGEAEVRVTGTLAAPAVTGFGRLQDGVYENMDTGLYVDALEAEVAGRDRVLELTRAAGTDGGDGVFAATGELRLLPDEGYPLRLQLEFTDAHLLRRDALNAVAGGTLGVGGTVEHPTLRGEITTQDVQGRLTGDLPPEIVALEVTEINQPPRQAEPVARRPARVAPLSLDVQLHMPERVFVRGRGLDSEWAGTLHITGSSDAPVVAGTLRPVRGQFSFAGKTFTLEEGTITFDGQPQNDALLDLAAVYHRVDLEAVIEIRGRASRPDITLTSLPELPQDEILARVLFNKSAADMTPWEAVQLTHAAAVLSGRGGRAEDIMDIARRTLGVDVLRIGSTEETGAPTVTVGSYLAEGVFVGIDQGMSPGESAVTVEVQVSPTVSVESKVGLDATESIGLRWKRDY